MLEVALIPDDPEARGRIARALDDHVLAVGQSIIGESLIIEAREGGAWVGGLALRVAQGWGFITQIATDEEARGHGVGRRLMEAAEALARDRELCGLWLITFSFQAPGFYTRLGYEEFGRIPDHPRGHSRLFFAKRLDGRPLAAGDPH